MKNNKNEVRETKESLIIDLVEYHSFSGLYGTIWNDWEDDSDYLEEIAKNLDIDINDIRVTLNYEKYLKEIAREFEFVIFDGLLELGYNIEVEYYDSYSPRFYNFDTDRIFLKLSSRNYTKSEIEKAFKEYIDSVNVELCDWFDCLEGQAYEKGGYELYYNNVNYTYKDTNIQLFDDTTKEELNKALKELENKDKA